MTEPSTDLLLRAELFHPRGQIITHTLHISTESVSVASGALLAPGTAVRLVLSFPGLVEPFDVDARVLSSRADHGPGQPALVTCDVRWASQQALDTLRGILERHNSTPSAKHDAGRSYRCLLVEDNGFLRELFEYGLTKYGRRGSKEVGLDMAHDAEQAWQMLEATSYDLAIVDHYLPLQNGSQLIARMRSDPKLARIPIVAISVGGPEVREAALAAGADMFLDKPIVLRDLLATLDRLREAHP